MTSKDPIDSFRRVLAGAARAVAHDPEVEVAYGGESSSGALGKVARVASPGVSLEPRLVAEARGTADALALRVRHSDPALHLSRSPVEPDARAVFDALETARVEALGARGMDGVRGNLAQLAEARVRGDAITRARTAEEVPLATAIGLIARQRLTGEAPPSAAATGLTLVTPWIEEKAGAELDALALTIDDQQAFATLARRLLEDLDLADAEESAEETPDEGGDDEEGDDDGADEPDNAGDEGSEAGGEMEIRQEQSQDQSEDDQQNVQADDDGDDSSSG